MANSINGQNESEDIQHSHGLADSRLRCTICGASKFILHEVLWPTLIHEWRISQREVDYINRQQGLCCETCGSNLRSMVLALAIMRCLDYIGMFKQFVRERKARKLWVLEINEAKDLTKYLNQIPRHLLKEYPEIDIMNLRIPDSEYDLVVHSDTLEHVQDPVIALAECCRVLKPGGFCCFTVPMIMDRLTQSRKGMPPSYHGNEQNRSANYIVHTEYGSDAWKHVIQAGFEECRIHSLEYPSALALVGVKRPFERRSWRIWK